MRIQRSQSKGLEFGNARVKEKKRNAFRENWSSFILHVMVIPDRL